MKFKFADNLEYQLEAIGAVVDIFDTGRNVAQAESLFELRSAVSVVKNELEIDEARILKNVRAIQKRNGIVEKAHNGGAFGEHMLGSEPDQKLGTLDFSVEMETGTGKTYVYLRTIFELNRKYGLKKFIILVPSVAIREGVLKTLEQTKGHFRDMYGVGYGYFAYDSGRLTRVREFAQSLDIEIMVMTIQSFNGDDRVMRQTPDRFNGESPLGLVSATRPVVIMDEPQNMESELAKSSIKDLDPLFKLRYSATHKELHHLVYRLTPVDAYKRGLVKKITVFGVKENDPNAFVFKVRSIGTKKGEFPKAKVVVEVKIADGNFVRKELLLKAGDDVKRKTNNDRYEGVQVNDVDARHGRVELSDGKYYRISEEQENQEAIFRMQIRETIKAHLDKQEELGGSVKVLSLFFIDRVDNYIHEDSLIRTIFAEEFERLKTKYARFESIDHDAVQKGYFASKKEKGLVTFQDTRGDSKMDKEAYDLIMKDKERLLSFAEPVSFIFSHSALKEGWDNPNIFQICTLRETNSLMKKRQEIGRGLRLPVDTGGNRIYDSRINILTVVANESYQEYVGQLQAEFTEAGYVEPLETTDAREEKLSVHTTKHIDDEDFKKLWDRISKRTVYNIEVGTELLIVNAVEKIDGLDISNLVVTVDKVNVYFDEKDTIQTVFAGQSAGMKLERSFSLRNIVDRIARETGLTKGTILTILSRVGNIGLLFGNPEEYIRSVVVIVNGCLGDLLINEGLKYIPTGDRWEIRLLFADFEVLPSRSIGSDKSAFDRVVFDSLGEKRFAQHLEQSQNVRIYTKLPRGFVIDTPLGGYAPDWAIVWDTGEGEKLYLVRETKFGYADIRSELPLVEQQKIVCGTKHFEAIGFDDFKLAQREDLSDLFVGHTGMEQADRTGE